MSEGLYDEDGVDGPFERRMRRAMRDDARRMPIRYAHPFKAHPKGRDVCCHTRSKSSGGRAYCGGRECDHRSSRKLVVPEAPRTRVEFRAIWKRVGLKPKSKVFRSRKCAERRLVLLGPEPWLAFSGRDAQPDAKVCCSGYECGCGGETIRERALALRTDMPALEWARIETRTVTETPWSAA